MKQEVKDYLDEIINQGLENDFWFMTKQSMTDFYLIFTQSKVVETFNAHHKSNENFGTYYSRFFRENAELNKRYAAQGASDNTYRNAISAESLGLFYRENDSYTSGKVTPAYRAIERYVKSFEDSVKYKFLFERQIEKLCLNINPKLGNYENLKNVRNFPVMMVYKIMHELYKETGDSKLFFPEFVLFLFRAKTYSDWPRVLDLILKYREEGLDSEYEEKANMILTDGTAANIRLDTLIGTLSNITFTDKKHGNYFKIKDDYESLRYIENAIEIFEASTYSTETDSSILLEFLRSDKYFIGNLDIGVKVADAVDNDNSDLDSVIIEHWNAKDFDYKEIDEPLHDFREEFGKEAIESMSDEECLLKLFGKKEEKSLVYYLEHVDKYWYFGRISNYRHNYILYEKDGNWRYATSARSITEISESDAKEYAKQFRDMFVNVFNLIEDSINSGALSTMGGYESIYSDIKDLLGVFYNKNWVWKYIYMLYPEYFVPFYSNEWVNKMFRVARLVPSSNYVTQCGQFTIYSRKLGISPIYVYRILCLIDDAEVNEAEEGSEEIENEPLASKYDNCERLKIGENTILYGVPGAGKSWTIKNEYCDANTIIERVVFHPDYTYSDFVGQILPKVDENGTVSYSFTPGPFTTILKKAYKTPDKKFYLVIEEVNRGNAPAIFGDIFQLLDRTIDGNSEYEITNSDIAALVYEDANHKVSIPSNLSILCTMNTSDQNVFTLDTAFQRRWNMRLIQNKFHSGEEKEQEFASTKILDTTVTWEKFFTEINKIILDKNIRMTSSEDKRLGTHFVSPEDLKFEEGNNKQNSKFPEKVLKYLWDDAFKFTKEDVFDLEKVKSLEDVIELFLSAKGNDRFKVFKENIFNTIVVKVSGETATTENN